MPVAAAPATAEGGARARAGALAAAVPTTATAAWPARPLLLAVPPVWGYPPHHAATLATATTIIATTVNAGVPRTKGRLTTAAAAAVGGGGVHAPARAGRRGRRR